ncbi:hypothetical protein Ancab_014739 [Ancistrocladus abbreviatus]
MANCINWLSSSPSDSPIFASLCSRCSHSPQTIFSLHHIPKKVSYSSSGRRRVSSPAINCRTVTEEKAVSDDRMLVFVPPHPLVKHWVSVLRNEQTPCPIFRYSSLCKSNWE